MWFKKSTCFSFWLIWRYWTSKNLFLRKDISGSVAEWTCQYLYPRPSTRPSHPFQNFGQFPWRNYKGTKRRNLKAVTDWSILIKMSTLSGFFPFLIDMNHFLGETCVLLLKKNQQLAFMFNIWFYLYLTDCVIFWKEKTNKQKESSNKRLSCPFSAGSIFNIYLFRYIKKVLASSATAITNLKADARFVWV